MHSAPMQFSGSSVDTLDFIPKVFLPTLASGGGGQMEPFSGAAAAASPPASASASASPSPSLASSGDDDDGGEDQFCQTNCSGHGVCFNGSCYCQIRFEGSECKTLNFAYHAAFASIFFLMALTSLIQLVMCIHAEYLRMKKHPSYLRACRVTTQKFIYFLVFLASMLRGAYFAAPTLSTPWSVSLLSAYYPVVLTGASLIVCFWAEVFHLREIRWDRPRFLSKSFLGFVTFNIITYSLLIAELLLVWMEHDQRDFYANIFNGCYAVLMFVVVIFFLVYGVEVFFKVRGGFTVLRIQGVHSTPAATSTPAAVADGVGEANRIPLLPCPNPRPILFEEKVGGSGRDFDPSTPAGQLMLSSSDEVRANSFTVLRRTMTVHNSGGPAPAPASVPVSAARSGETPTPTSSSWPERPEEAVVNTSQLHQSRLGLLSQALMMIITVGFLFSETLEKFWKTKVDLTSRNTHDIIFRTVEIGVALWFPCVLWNCIRPEQLWCLNPKKILESFPPLRECVKGDEAAAADIAATADSADEDDNGGGVSGPECWICYDSDRADAGAMINPCNCRGDVGAVHHDCLRRWLVESADNPEALKCKVCNEMYMVEKGSQFSLSHGFTLKHWLQTASLVTVMSLTVTGCWAVIHYHTQPWAKMLAVGTGLLVSYCCLRSLGLNTVTAYQRAKVSALKIYNLKRGRSAAAAAARHRHTSHHNLHSLRVIQSDATRI